MERGLFKVKYGGEKRRIQSKRIVCRFVGVFPLYFIVVGVVLLLGVFFQGCPIFDKILISSFIFLERIGAVLFVASNALPSPKEERTKTKKKKNQSCVFVLPIWFMKFEQVFLKTYLSISTFWFVFVFVFVFVFGSLFISPSFPLCFLFFFLCFFFFFLS